MSVMAVLASRLSLTLIVFILTLIRFCHTIDFEIGNRREIPAVRVLIDGKRCAPYQRLVKQSVAEVSIIGKAGQSAMALLIQFNQELSMRGRTEDLINIRMSFVVREKMRLR